MIIKLELFSYSPIDNYIIPQDTQVEKAEGERYEVCLDIGILRQRALWQLLQLMVVAESGRPRDSGAARDRARHGCKYPGRLRCHEGNKLWEARRTVIDVVIDGVLEWRGVYAEALAYMNIVGMISSWQAYA